MVESSYNYMFLEEMWAKVLLQTQSGAMAATTALVIKSVQVGD